MIVATFDNFIMGIFTQVDLRARPHAPARSEQGGPLLVVERFEQKAFDLPTSWLLAADAGREHLGVVEHKAISRAKIVGNGSELRHNGIAGLARQHQHA